MYAEGSDDHKLRQPRCTRTNPYDRKPLFIRGMIGDPYSEQ
jgi:hypothetical protein